MTGVRVGRHPAAIAAWVLSLACCGSALAGPSAAERFTSATVSADGQELSLQLGGRSTPARRLEGQVAFDAAKVSDDGRHAGWLALFGNCCTSYPVPMALVVMGATGRLHTFEGAQATFGWCFVDRGRSVALMRSALHGGGPEQYELRRLTDGKLMKSHITPVDRDGQPDAEAKLPSWVGCAQSK